MIVGGYVLNKYFKKRAPQKETNELISTFLNCWKITNIYEHVFRAFGAKKNACGETKSPSAGRAAHISRATKGAGQKQQKLKTN